ncbi:Metallo-dependent hydrolase [Polychaeton citri CBS 116435]|uniref:Metallo-dependent hydrolase n=1 Tax=Polychaeton citri CBS 116435 TaxID=1314669 RepID=A0A9P4UN34_9PEZI|nr:Metallo-dependent hydrolase [Polychaeton citri CBS 116435]
MAFQVVDSRKYHAPEALSLTSIEQTTTRTTTNTCAMLSRIGRQLKRQFSKSHVQAQEEERYNDLKSTAVPGQVTSHQQQYMGSDSSGTPNPDSTMDAEHLLSQEVKSNEGNEAYRNEREQLLDAEDQERWDRPARSSATRNERTAEQIVRKLVENERIDPTLFGNVPSEKVPSQDSRDLGGRFLANKPRILRSKVFKIARKMPKGGHLHEHFNSELMPEVLLPLIPRFVPDTMFIRTSRPLISAPDAVESECDFSMAEIVFNVMPQDTKVGDCFQPSYNPDVKDPNARPWMRWTDFQSKFPEGVYTEDSNTKELEHLNNAEKWARERMVITRERAYSPTQTHNGSWACFNQGTRAFKGLVNYEGVYRWYIGAAIQNMIDDGIMYAELRPMLLDKSIPSDDGLRQLTHSDQMKIICEEVRKKQEHLASENRLHKFPFGVKIIYSTPRSIPLQKMQSELSDCIQLKREFPNLICGFDLVGAEDRPNCISYYADLLVSFTKTCEKLDIEIPFMFHAGETLLDTGGSHDPSKSNLYDSLLLKAKRIGHGYALTRHPLLIKKYKEANIALELCPISNEVLHLCANVRDHPYPALLGAGLHCTLNSDNPSLFRPPYSLSSSPAHLTNEFYQVMVGDTRMTVHGWKQLALWSLEHSCLGAKRRDDGRKESEQEEAKAIFMREWEAWCAWVVEEFGDYVDSLPDLI